MVCSEAAVFVHRGEFLSLETLTEEKKSPIIYVRRLPVHLRRSIRTLDNEPASLRSPKASVR